MIILQIIFWYARYQQDLELTKSSVLGEGKPLVFQEFDQMKDLTN